MYEEHENTAQITGRVLIVGDLVLDEPELTLPHPRARQRAFVLEPLAEVLPGFRWPDMV